MNSKIMDTFAEASESVFCQLDITADDMKTLRKAAQNSTALPSIVMNRVEGGIVRYLSKDETPDNRLGARVQFWPGINPKKTFKENMEKFETELSYRIRQGILVKPFTAVYDAMRNAEGKLDIMNTVGHCGDAYEHIEMSHGRKVVVVPITTPDFVIENEIGYKHGVSGGNFQILCSSKKAVKQAGDRALEAIHEVEGVITPFDVCAAGSKPETKYPWIGPTTNHPYCPSLKKRLGKESKVPPGVKYIPEIVINGDSLKSVRTAMREGIEAAVDVNGVKYISAVNFDGKFGKYIIKLHSLFR